jgi:hypothetical protein
MHSDRDERRRDKSASGAVRFEEIC